MEGSAEVSAEQASDTGAVAVALVSLLSCDSTSSSCDGAHGLRAVGLQLEYFGSSMRCLAMTGRCFSFSRRTPRAEEYGDVPDSNSSTYAVCTGHASQARAALAFTRGQGRASSVSRAGEAGHAGGRPRKERLGRRRDGTGRRGGVSSLGFVGERFLGRVRFPGNAAISDSGSRGTLAGRTGANGSAACTAESSEPTDIAEGGRDRPLPTAAAASSPPPPPPPAPACAVFGAAAAS